MYRVALNRTSGVVHGHPHPRNCPVPLAKVGKERQGTGRQGSDPMEYGQGKRENEQERQREEKRPVQASAAKGRREVRDGDERQYGQ